MNLTGLPHQELLLFLLRSDQLYTLCGLTLAPGPEAGRQKTSELGCVLRAFSDRCLFHSHAIPEES
jgi:hypothetical protein